MLFVHLGVVCCFESSGCLSSAALHTKVLLLLSSLALSSAALFTRRLLVLLSSVLLQRDRFVCCLDLRGHYARTEAEAAATLDTLRCVLSSAAFAKPCRGAASVAPLLPKGKVKEGAYMVLLQLAVRIAVPNLHKNARKSFSEM